MLDIWLQGSKLDGIQVLDTLKREQPDLPVVMISGHGTIETAVAAIKKGAYDFIEKPFKADRLIHVVGRALEAARLRREVQELKLKAGDDSEMVGNSSAISQLRQAIEKIAPTNSRVLITGPSGSGKEVAARLIHRARAAPATPSSPSIAPPWRLRASRANCSAWKAARAAQERPVRAGA